MTSPPHFVVEPGTVIVLRGDLPNPAVAQDLVDEIREVAGHDRFVLIAVGAGVDIHALDDAARRDLWDAIAGPVPGLRWCTVHAAPAYAVRGRCIAYPFTDPRCDLRRLGYLP